MLRTCGNSNTRQRLYVMSTDELRLQFLWAISQAHMVHTSRRIKVYDENGDEFSSKMDQLAHQYEWDQTMHPMFIVDEEAAQIDSD